jgi:hypothetical protein
MDESVKNVLDQSDVFVDHVVSFAPNTVQSLVLLGKFVELFQGDLVFNLVQLRTVLIQDGVEEIILGVLFNFALEGEDS